MSVRSRSSRDDLNVALRAQDLLRPGRADARPLLFGQLEHHRRSLAAVALVEGHALANPIDRLVVEFVEDGSRSPRARSPKAPCLVRAVRREAVGIGQAV